MFQSSCRFAFFVNLSSFKPNTKLTRISTLYQANAPTLTRCNFFIKHITKFIIFGPHNPQTFRHNALINKLLLMQLFLFNIRPKLHRRKWRKLSGTLFRTFMTTSSLLMLLFVQPLSGNFVINYQAMLPLHSYRLLIKILSSLLNGAMLTGSVRRNCQNLRYFRCTV